ncbi:hypothetical protein FD754_019191, partial [Muntiacus muntjak]
TLLYIKYINNKDLLHNTGYKERLCDNWTFIFTHCYLFRVLRGVIFSVWDLLNPGIKPAPPAWQVHSLPLGDLLNPGIKPRSPALQVDSLSAEPRGKPKNTGVGSDNGSCSKRRKKYVRFPFDWGGRASWRAAESRILQGTSGDHWQSLVFLEFIILIILNKQFCKSTYNARDPGWIPGSGRSLENSIYLRLRKRNHCNHRDYQNISKNGILSRNQLLDYPAIVIYAMIGNDVCSGNIDPLPEMTTPEKLYSKVMQTLQYLDSHLPNGSHVILHGLPDGRFLWDHLHDRYHPLGQLNKDVTYAHFYSFLNCLQVSPCHGWMSSNKTLRNLTSERAEQLSTTLKKIATSQKFMNFDLFYLDFDFQKIVKKWQKRGGQPWQLIEPVDGFHPNEVVSQLFADLFWEKMQRQWPHVLGKENPFNPQIEQVFGDQGGH